MRAVAYNAATGHYLVTWPDAREGDAADVYARAVEGGSGNPRREFLVYAGEEDQYTPAVAANGADGEYLVVWQEGNPGDIYGQRTLTEDTTGDALVITTADEAQQAPAVAWNWVPLPLRGEGSGEGVYLVVWAHDNGSDDDVRGRVVAADGDLLGAEITIAAAAAAEQYPAVAANGAGGYVVAWQTYPPFPLPGAGRGSLRPPHRGEAAVGAAHTVESPLRLKLSDRRSSMVAGRYGCDAHVIIEAPGAVPSRRMGSSPEVWPFLGRRQSCSG